MTGAQTEDVGETLTIFSARVKLKSADAASQVVTQRAVKYLPLLVRAAAAEFAADAIQ